MGTQKQLALDPPAPSKRRLQSTVDVVAVTVRHSTLKHGEKAGAAAAKTADKMRTKSKEEK